MALKELQMMTVSNWAIFLASEILRVVTDLLALGRSTRIFVVLTSIG